MSSIQCTATIIKRSHHFVIKNPTPSIVKCIYKLSELYTQHGMVFDRDKRRNVWKPLKTFGIYVDGGREFRFHIGQYQEFMELLQSNFVDRTSYELFEEEDYEADSVDLEMMGDKTLYPEQEDAVEFITSSLDRENNSNLIMFPMGVGKEQPLTAKIKIPSGWTLMGDLKIGSEVIARDGSVTFVNGIYPQGQKPIYKILFEDGRSTECGIDHLWKVYTPNFEGKNPRIIKTLEIARLLKLPTYKDRLHIDLPISEEGVDIELPVEPYLLGVLLGDGHLGKKSVELSTPDQEILDSVKEILSEELTLRHSDRINYRIVNKIQRGNQKNSLLEDFRKIKLSGKRSYEKHIPEIYFNSSKAQRLALVQGLLDTDGTVSADHGTVSFCSTSKLLAEGVQYLIRSLGGLARISTKRPFFTYKNIRKEGRLAYIVNIRYKNGNELFRLSKKKNRTFECNQYSNSLKLRIKSIEFIGHKEAQCISISHPEHLYVTDDFIVTHNTVTSLSAVQKIGKRFAVMILGGYVEKWIKDIMSNMKISRDEIAVIKGADSLQRCTNYPDSGLPIPKAFVISVNTMSKWYKKYEENSNNPELEAYACMPCDFFEHLKIGCVIFDEIHQHLHAVYRAFTFTHVPKVIALSATFISKDPTIKKVQSIMFPHFRRYDKVRMKRYITSHACAYQIMNFGISKIQTTEWGQNSYSQVAYEKSILSNRHRALKIQYLKMITDLTEDAYISRKVDGDKLAIFVGSKAMAEEVVAALKVKYPHLDIRTYLQENDYADLLDPDIRVTTILSAGTAHDIPNLRVTIMTINVDSPVANLQTFGRLREMKHRTHDNDVHFYYVYCSSIQKHVDYHENRVKLLADRVLEQKHEFLGTLYP